MNIIKTPNPKSSSGNSCNLETSAHLKLPRHDLGSTAQDTMYAIKPICGGSTSSATQITRMSVTSASKYSANPAQTPAIFCCDTILRSLRGGAVAGPPGAASLDPTGFPHAVQKRAESAS